MALVDYTAGEVGAEAMARIMAELVEAGDEPEAMMQRAALAMPFFAVRALLDMGVPAGLVAGLTGAGLLGRLRVAERGGLWREDPDGAPRLLLGVRDRAGEVIDIAALSSTDPDAWALMTGDGWLLGWDRVEDAALADPETAPVVKMHARPIDWLRAGGEGACLLDYGPGALGELRALGPAVELACEDDKAAAALAGLLQWGGLPRCVAPRNERKAA